MLKRCMRIGMPAMLAVIGLGFLSGCLFIPTFNATVEGKNLSGKIGDASSKAPLRVGRATIADVYRVFGPPHYASEDGRRLGYTWKVLNGYWIGLCFGPQHQDRYLVLDFDTDGVLRGTKIDSGGVNMPGGWRQSEGPAPQWDGMNHIDPSSGPSLVPSTQSVNISPETTPATPRSGDPLPPGATSYSTTPPR